MLIGLGFDDGEQVIALVAQQVVGALGFAAAGGAAGDEDAAVGEGGLLGDLVVGPAGVLEPGRDVDAAGIGFAAHGAFSIGEVWQARRGGALWRCTSHSSNSSGKRQFTGTERGCE